MLIIVGAGTRKGSPEIRNDEKMGESGIKICLRGRTWGSSGGFLFPFSFTLVVMEH